MSSDVSLPDASATSDGVSLPSNGSDGGLPFESDAIASGARMDTELVDDASELLLVGRDEPNNEGHLLVDDPSLDDIDLSDLLDDHDRLRGGIAATPIASNMEQMLAQAPHDWSL